MTFPRIVSSFNRRQEVNKLFIHLAHRFPLHGNSGNNDHLFKGHLKAPIVTQRYVVYRIRVLGTQIVQVMPRLSRLPSFVLRLLTNVQLFTLTYRAYNSGPLVSEANRSVRANTMIAFLQIRPLSTIPTHLSVILYGL